VDYSPPAEQGRPLRQPRILWAVTHQTLARSDVPALEAAGFTVVAEEPELSVIRDSDALEYPLVGERGSEWGPYRRLRLWARDGLVSAEEARAVNDAFDAVMVHTRLDVARNVRSWFDGAVLFRHFGEMPWVSGDADVSDGSIAHAGIHYVPLLPSLAGTPLARTFDETLLLRSTLPAAEEAVGAIRRDGDPVRIGLFVEKITDVAKVRSWVRDLARGLPDGEVVVLGLEAAVRAGFGEAPPNVVVPPRLEALAYWRLFGSLSALVYPYSNPRHIHYVPYEAIALGIPCFTLESAQVAVDLRGIGAGAGDERMTGISASPSEAISRALVAVGDADLLRSIWSGQKPVLDLLSPDAVLGQSAALREAVETATAGRVRGDGDPPEIRSPMPALTVRAFGLGSGVGDTIEIASAAVVTAAELGDGVHGAFVAECGHKDGLVVELAPGESHFLRLGMPAAGADATRFVRVDVATDPCPRFPAELTTIRTEGSQWSNFVRRSGVEWGSASTWTAVAQIGPRDSLRVKVFGDEMKGPIRLRRIAIEVMDEAQWWAEREQHLLEALTVLQDGNTHLAAYASRIERECERLKHAAEEAGRWGADLERQLLAQRPNGTHGARARARAAALLKRRR